eukprot:CAMPEP_0118917482 /NCGR_PEP_ID=MMETSP1166-20130328/17355_1 /TAXON_ID=1104430 /ORGANISM="Chrysoreinhardia sp, Strain CCMP3193" /LENGTH=308 /DNA_ID=CAMNT_0006857663 /DNA_START=69 /DNA_END=995 /DNA_ORIENTATION=+
MRSAADDERRERRDMADTKVGEPRSKRKRRGRSPKRHDDDDDDQRSPCDLERLVVRYVGDDPEPPGVGDRVDHHRIDDDDDDDDRRDDDEVVVVVEAFQSWTLLDDDDHVEGKEGNCVKRPMCERVRTKCFLKRCDFEICNSTGQIVTVRIRRAIRRRATGLVGAVANCVRASARETETRERFYADTLIAKDRTQRFLPGSGALAVYVFAKTAPDQPDKWVYIFGATVHTARVKAITLDHADLAREKPISADELRDLGADPTQHILLPPGAADNKKNLAALSDASRRRTKKPRRHARREGSSSYTAAS